jgi:PAS domain S-box-containing protein
MVLDRDLRFVDANAAYCAVTMSKRSDLIGRHVFEAFPEDGENLRRYNDAFARALAGEDNVVALFPFRIPRPAEQGGGMELRYWSCTHTPVRDAAGAVTHVVQQAEDVTALVGEAPRADSVIEDKVLRRAEKLENLSERLRAEGDFLKRLFRSAPGFIAVLSGEDRVVELANDAFVKLVGREDIVGLPLAEAIPHISAGAGHAEADPNSDEAVLVEAFPLIVQQPDGDSRKVFVDFVWQPIMDDDGRPAAVFVQGNDVTEKVMVTRQQQLLLDEINHRVKNTLAVVQALVLQTLKSTPDPRAFSQKVQARLAALSATHNLLTATAWSGVELKSLLCQELSHFGESRISLEGPAALLSPRRTVNLGLVFHEMATNAAKYGALSVPDGRVQVSWRLEPDEETTRLLIDWQEEGGPPVVDPKATGFGLRLIERTLRSKPDARYTIDYRPDGLRAHFNMPAEIGDQP